MTGVSEVTIRKILVADKPEDEELMAYRGLGLIPKPDEGKEVDEYTLSAELAAQDLSDLLGDKTFEVLVQAIEPLEPAEIVVHCTCASLRSKNQILRVCYTGDVHGIMFTAINYADVFREAGACSDELAEYLPDLIRQANGHASSAYHRNFSAE